MAFNPTEEFKRIYQVSLYTIDVEGNETWESLHDARLALVRRHFQSAYALHDLFPTTNAKLPMPFDQVERWLLMNRDFVEDLYRAHDAIYAAARHEDLA